MANLPLQEKNKPDPTDRKELLESLEKWKNESKKQKHRFLRAQRLWQRAKKRIALRRKELKDLSIDRAPREFIRRCLTHVGEHEIGYSNTGRNIDKWEAECGLHAQPYCALFLMYMFHKTTGRKLNCAYAYTPNILGAARAGRDFTVVGPGGEKPGDWVLYNFGSSAPVQHVGAITKVLGPNRNYETVEGNTSPGNAGSQDNGGGVYIRERHGYGIVAVVRPKWKE